VEELSRTRMIVATVFVGVCAVAGLIVATYTFSNTPNIEDIRFHENGFLVGRGSKAAHVFGPVVVQMFLFVATLYHSVHWERVACNAIEKTAAYNAGQTRKVIWSTYTRSLAM
jgi:hypothetical protein